MTSPPDAQPAPARPAATVVLLRPAGADPREPRPPGFEVFLVKRHERIAFMGGTYVFPGGRYEPGDRVAEDADWCTGIADAAAHWPDLPREDAIGHHVAAMRELFEESGVLLGRDRSGRFLDTTVPETRDRLKAHRTALHRGARSLREIAEAEGVRLALETLLPLAHWVTPEVEGRRFDARFFITRLPYGQEPVHDESETIESRWLSPRAALDGHACLQINLPPPTMRILEELATFTTLDEVLLSTKTRVIRRIQPWFCEQHGTSLLVLPGDPLYPAGPDGRRGFGETRFVLEGGRWWSRRPPDE